MTGLPDPDVWLGDDIAPGQEVLTLGPSPRLMRWGILPVGRVNARGRPVMDTLVNVVVLGVFAAVFYCVAQTVLGRYAEIPTLSEAVHMQVR